jgi:hypothetical protein
MTGRDGASGAQLEKLRRLIHDRGTLAPVARLVDAHVLSVEPGHVVVRYAVSFLQPVTEGPVGRSTIFMEAVVRDGSGRDLVRATSIGAARKAKHS